MEKYCAKNIFHKVKGSAFRVRVPGSKSITNRALLLAMLSDGACCLDGSLFSDDSRYLQQCIADLGFEIRADEAAERIEVTGLGGGIPKEEASVYVGSAGTAARFLTALLGIKEGTWHLDASDQMRKRPMQPLLDSLEGLGTKISYEGEKGHFPFTLQIEKCPAQSTGESSMTEKKEAAEAGRSGNMREISVNIDHSSQFLSALLIAAGCGGQNLRIQVDGSHGMAYIDMTVRMMEQFGGAVIRQHDWTEKEYDTADDQNRNHRLWYEIASDSRYHHRHYAIEPDASAASYFYAMAAVLGIEGLVQGVHFDSLQGDVEFLRILQKMGCTLRDTEDGIWLKGPENGKLKGIEADMHACSDQAITLAAIAPYADAPVTITGIGHIRYQESNRVEAIVTELRRVGIACEEGEDYIKISPGKPIPGEIETYDDHRMAMGFSLLGLRSDGIVIRDPGCCRKTFEHYFEVLDQVIEEVCRSC